MGIANRKLMAYALPALPLAGLGLPLYVYAPSYYAEDLGLGLATVGGVLLVSRLVDMITDPIAGMLSDRITFSRNRRKVMIALGLPLLLLGVDALFRPPTAVTAYYLFGWSLVVYLGWTMVSLPYLAIGAEVGITFPLLEAVGFDSAQSNSATAMSTLAIVYAGLPVLIKLIALPLVWNFPLDQRQHRYLRESSTDRTKEDCPDAFRSSPTVASPVVERVQHRDH